jgi:hypothetical protein
VRRSQQKKAMRHHSERKACPSSELISAAHASLRRRQTEESGEGFWDAEELNGGSASGRGTGVARQPCFPRQAIMGTLRTRQDGRRGVWLGRRGLRQGDLHPLVAQQGHAGATIKPSTPILPEQGSRSNPERMQQHTDLARLRGRAAIPLALLAQRTGTTAANAGSIHHAQAPIGFSAVFMRDELLVSGATQRPIGLESKVLAREAPSFPGPTRCATRLQQRVSLISEEKGSPTSPNVPERWEYQQEKKRNERQMSKTMEHSGSEEEDLHFDATEAFAQEEDREHHHQCRIEVQQERNQSSRGHGERCEVGQGHACISHCTHEN